MLMEIRFEWYFNGISGYVYIYIILRSQAITPDYFVAYRGVKQN